MIKLHFFACVYSILNIEKELGIEADADDFLIKISLNSVLKLPIACVTRKIMHYTVDITSDLI